SWPYLFWINLPVVFVIFCITWWGLAGLPRLNVKGGIDWIGVVLLGAALLLLNIGLGAPEVGLEGSAALPSPHRLYWVAAAAAAIPGGWLSERLGYRTSVVIGLITAIAGFWMMSLWKVEMASQAVAFFDHMKQGAGAAEARGTGFMAAGLALAGIGIGLTIAPIGAAVINGVGEQDRGMASSLVIILRLIGMSVSMSSLMAYGLRRTPIL